MNSELIYREVCNEGTSLLQACNVVSAVTTLLNVECEPEFQQTGFCLGNSRYAHRGLGFFFFILQQLIYYVVEGQKSAALLFPFC